MSEIHESAPVKIALIVGSTRPNRFADVPARWVADAAAARGDIALEVLDLRDWPLPFYDEPLTPLFSGGKFSNPQAAAWANKIGEFDGFLATAAEYNHGPTAVLKNAIDSAAYEWHNKPIGFIGYGGVGGARAVEQLRLHAVEMAMAPIRAAVHINMEPFLGVARDGKSLDDYPYLVQTRDAMLDQLVWWAKALRAARSVPVAA